MSAAPEFKYTDRDVREDSSLEPLAIAYLLNYGGEFEPLVEAKEYLAEYGELTTLLVRKTLNCMRHDVNVLSKLPRPERNTDNVVDINTSRRKNRKEVWKCEETKPHEYHWNRDAQQACQGVPFAINRVDFRIKVNVKRPFAIARQGRVVHGTNGYAYISAIPPRHQWGMSRLQDLNVKTVCINPSWLKNPFLLTESEVGRYVNQVGINGFDIKMCPRCMSAS